MFFSERCKVKEIDTILKKSAVSYRIPIFAICLLMAVSICSFSGQAAYDPVSFRDAKLYTQLIGKLRNIKKPQDQIALMKDFIFEHPQNKFNEELNTNLMQLQKLVKAQDPSFKKNEMDFHRYKQVIGFAKSLRSNEEKKRLWRQFISENPESLFLKEAKQQLSKLK